VNVSRNTNTNLWVSFDRVIDARQTSIALRKPSDGSGSSEITLANGSDGNLLQGRGEYRSAKNAAIPNLRVRVASAKITRWLVAGTQFFDDVCLPGYSILA